MEPLTLKLLLGGDLMLGRGIDQQMPQHCDPTLHEAVVRVGGWNRNAAALRHWQPSHTPPR